MYVNMHIVFHYYYYLCNGFNDDTGCPLQYQKLPFNCNQVPSFIFNEICYVFFSQAEG